MTSNAPDGAGVSRRRAVTTVAGVVVAGIAGCVSTGGPDPTAADTSTDARERTDAGRPGTETTDADASAGETAVDTHAEGAAAPPTEGTTSMSRTPPTQSGGLDLREANVVGVAFEPEGGGYRFDVTLYHDDDGEEGYANWWQVETLDGERLGRRELLHAHGTREFTRSGTVDVPDGVTCVVVRGHDRIHGYGGDAALVTLDSGATTTIRQGPERRAFGPSDCP